MGATDELVLAFAPRGVDPITWAIVAAAIVVSIAATFLLMPKAPSPDEAGKAGSVYSVGLSANEAKLGAPVPLCYGRVTRTPDYAAQSYRWFEGNQEIRAFLLCLGGGELEVEAVRLGETPVGDLPPGLVEWQAFKPAAHGGRLGAIPAVFPIEENVFTSGDVASQDLGARMKFQGRARASFSGSVITFEDSSIAGQAATGDQLVVRKSPANGDYVVAQVQGSRVTVQGPLSGSGTGEFDLAILSGGSTIVGPFVTNPAGTRTRRIEFDLEWPGGLSQRDEEGKIRPMTVDLTATFQPIGDDGQTAGAAFSYGFTETAATATPQRRTWRLDVPAGRYRVSLERTDQRDVRNETDRTVWSGLKAYLDTEPGAPAYGDVTLLALTVRGAEELSQTAQSRIFVTTEMLIPKLGTGEKMRSANPADVLADIMLRRSGRAALSIEGVHEEGLAAWREGLEGRSGFNGVFDTRQTLWAALQAVARRGRADPVMRGGRLGVAVDGPKPVRRGLVTADAVIANSLKIQWAFRRQGDPDGVEIEYRDPETFAERQVRWPESALFPRTVKPLGLTDAAEAVEEAKYLWDDLNRRNMEVTFQTTDAANLFGRFDRIGLAHPMFDWGRSVRLVRADGLRLLVSGPVPEGPVFVVIRTPEGEVSDMLPATGLPGRVLQFAEALPVALTGDDAGVPSLIAVSTPDAAIIDLTVRKVSPTGRAFSVTAANYVADLGEGA
ncbi:MAG: hypothetical protein IPK75_01310 [Acidobacteria bacterium]|nr:hypothetical protein [Acidobacteriota bacterium]